MTIHRLDDLLAALWVQYTADNPQAAAIHDALGEKGEQVQNDHIAFRTFNGSRVGVSALAKAFEGFGYEAKGQYTFEAKHLNATHYEHADEGYPRVFISELVIEDFSPFLQETVGALVEQVDDAAVSQVGFSASGLPWAPVSFETYETLREESEYAAWLAAFGYRANHFTILVNALSQYDSLQNFNTFIESLGFALNRSGGQIKGSPEVYLEQSSTLAHPVDVTFSDGVHRIPCCYYEFALRYPQADGTLYSGFVAKSADKIFESTDKAHHRDTNR